MVIHRDGPTTQLLLGLRRRNLDWGPAEMPKTLCWPLSCAGSASNSASSQRPKRVAESAGSAESPQVVHPMAEIGKSLAEIAEIPGENLARETVHNFTVSLSGCSPNENNRQKRAKPNALP